MAAVNTVQPGKTLTTLERVVRDIRYEHLIAGISGGLTSTLVLHPLDLIKIRFAVHDGQTTTTPKYRGIGNALATIFRQEGFRGLYRGVTPNLWGSGSSWGLYFLFYTTIKTTVQNGDVKVALSPLVHMLCASQAGIMTLAMTNPIWVVKTRLCLQYADSHTSGLPYKTYSGMGDALKKIYLSEGIRGLYKGFVPGIFGVSHGAVQFMMYEEMKKQYCQYKNVPINAKLGNVEYLSFAALSKLVAVSVTYPYQVIRARLQSQHRRYDSAYDCVAKTWTYEGWAGFYKGLGTNLLKVVPATMITFVTYENVSHFLMDLKADSANH